MSWDRFYSRLQSCITSSLLACRRAAQGLMLLWRAEGLSHLLAWLQAFMLHKELPTNKKAHIHVMPCAGGNMQPFNACVVSAGPCESGMSPPEILATLKPNGVGSCWNNSLVLCVEFCHCLCLRSIWTGILATLSTTTHTHTKLRRELKGWQAEERQKH